MNDSKKTCMVGSHDVEQNTKETFQLLVYKSHKYISKIFWNLHFFSPGVIHEVKTSFLPKLVVQRLMITPYTSEACECISYHSTVATLEINEMASCTDSI